MRNRTLVNLRSGGVLDELLTQAELRLNASLDPGTVRIGGEDAATCGAASDRGTWVRLQHRALNAEPSPRWDAEAKAARLPGVRKPAWHQSVTWNDRHREVEWRADELDLVTSPVVGSLTTPPTPTPQRWWWHEIKHSLQALSHQHTSRVAATQEDIDQEISSLAGAESLDTHVDEWFPAHGDLCWPNLTRDGQLLDWEAWGQAPRGYDAATLWGLSLPYPELANAVHETFADDLDSRSGQLARLAWCSSALRAAGRADLAHYEEPVHSAARRLLRELNTDHRRYTGRAATG